MLAPIHRAVAAVLHVIVVAFVALSARIRYWVRRSKHWNTAAMAAVAAAVVYVLANSDAWMWIVAKWMW
jgi:cell shape-determining protein MreC